jgi:hypothetical protein
LAIGQKTDGDRHVLATATKGDAEILVTANLKHFPATALAPYGIEALHLDEFALRLIESVPARVRAAARDHRHSLKNPPLDPRAARTGTLPSSPCYGGAPAVTMPKLLALAFASLVPWGFGRAGQSLVSDAARFQLPLGQADAWLEAHGVSLVGT